MSGHDLGPGRDRELAQVIAAIPWFQRYPIHGIMTPGRHDVQALLARLGLPERLDGRSVLDLGASANDGFFSFEAERRGAGYVLAVDSPRWGMRGKGACRKKGFLLARRIFGSDVYHQEQDIEDLDPPKMGTFDLVLMLGVLYHLESPLRAVRRAVACVAPGGLLVVETLLDAFEVPGPSMDFYPDGHSGDPTVRWGPNPAAVLAMMEGAGLEAEEHGPGRVWSGDHLRGVFHGRQPRS